MSEYLVRVATKHLQPAAVGHDHQLRSEPERLRILVLGREARNGRAEGFAGPLGPFALTPAQYAAGRGVHWGTGRFPPMWTIPHRIVFESLHPDARPRPAAAIRFWFDAHPKVSPLAFADVSPAHADAGVGAPGEVPMEAIEQHLAQVAQTLDGLQVQPRLILHPRLGAFRRNQQRVRELLEELAGEATLVEVPFFRGTLWPRGRTPAHLNGAILAALEGWSA